MRGLLKTASRSTEEQFYPIFFDIKIDLNVFIEIFDLYQDYIQVHK